MEDNTFECIIKNSLGKLINVIKCDDIIAGEDGEFWFAKDIRRNKDDLAKKINDLNKENKKTIVIVLESPHVDEFDTTGFKDKTIKASPALGKTGTHLQYYFTDKFLRDKLGKEYPSEGYQVILMNSIQYQCSLGISTDIYRDHIWISSWEKFGKRDFENRLRAYNPAIIFNLCTLGSHSSEPGIDKKYISSNPKKPILEIYYNYCTDSESQYFQLDDKFSLRDFVQFSIDEVVPEAKKFWGSHPSSWRHGKIGTITKKRNLIN